MSETETELEVAEVVEVPTADPRNLQGFQLPNMMWMFCAYTEDAAFDIMEAYPQLSSFYLIGTDEKDADDMRIFKINRSLMGWAINSVGLAPDTYVGLAKVETGARYKFPPIPSALVEKVDAFFRKVAKDLGTEAIVLLTLDPITMEFGVLVPKQNNSAAHCDYDPLSAHDERPDHVMLVGSMHSHPGMSAYASGTDHHDQETFDGVHITFGYPHGKSGTEFYAEMQLGNRYTLSLEHVFETVAPETDFPELEEWSSRVSKAVPTTAGTGVTHRTYTDSPSSSITTSSTPRRYNSGSPTMLALEKRENRPPGVPNPTEHVIIVRLEPNEVVCPVCKKDLDSYARTDMKCWHCFTYFFDDDVDTLEKLIEYRKEKGRTAAEIDYAVTPPPRIPIMEWIRKINDKGELSQQSYATPLWKPNAKGGGDRFF